MTPRTAAILLSATALAACDRAEAPAPAPANQSAAAPAAASGPVEQAHAMVLAELDGGWADGSFRDDRSYDHQGATVVCGIYDPPSGGEQRYIAVIESGDVFFEGAMEPGTMDAAQAEFCRAEASAALAPPRPAGGSA